MNARRVSAEFAMPLGTEFQVSATPFMSEAFPAIATDVSGRTVVTWQCIVDPGNQHGEVIARMVGPFAMPLGTEFQVSSVVANPQASVQRNPKIDTDRDGGFVVVWEADDLSATTPPEVVGEALDITPVP